MLLCLAGLAVAVTVLVGQPGAAEGDAGPPPGDLAAMVSATAGPEAVAAGVRALQAGGTAADAALTTSLANIVLHAGQSVSFTGFMNLVYYRGCPGCFRSRSATRGPTALLECGESGARAPPPRGHDGRASRAESRASHDREGADRSMGTISSARDPRRPG
jgi:hypothetical protein